MRSEAKNHLSLRLTTRSEARNTQRHALCLTMRSKAMTHLALRLTTRSEARNTQRHALRLTARSEAMTHLALRLTARSEARNTQCHALCLTARSEEMTHLVLRLTTRSEARNKYIYIYSPFQGGSFRTIPSLSRKCSNFTQDRGLVNTSTTCSSVLMYWSFKAPLYTMSQMK
jgi:hypothetical protein